MEDIVRRLAEVVVRQQRFSEQLAQRQEQTDQVVGLLMESAAARVPLPDARSTAHQLMTKLTAQDDIEAYLHTFEVIATREAWDKAEWAKILAPFLTGEAQRAYVALQPPASEDYDALKREILARLGLSPISAAQQFHQWSYEDQVPVRAQAARLSRLVQLWLLAGEPSASQVAERVVVDRLLRALPRRCRTTVGMKGPTTLREVVEAVELAEASAARDTGERAWAPPRRVNPAWRPQEGTSRPVPRPAAATPPDEPMPTEPSSHGPPAWLAGCAVHQAVPSGAPRRTVRVEGWPVTATLDSGSSVTLVQPGIVQPRAGGRSSIPITCVHGDTRNVPSRQVTVAAGPGSWTLEIGIVDDLPVPMLLGRDWPGFDQLLASTVRPASRELRGRKARSRKERRPRPVLLATESEKEGEPRPKPSPKNSS
ncbi:hypothetical protein IRJ41_013900 [Triplophysa rosa]|uniref:SCAN box domain-containing protein n=1 Tax=Triplophysa rosa TaxID=992332 RepID=A0A9W7T4D2_TRIRA|nr:hypothetical protein IRJ41_013900 [Triplophysa rosa]